MARYFARSNGNFDNAARWSLTPAGAGGAGIPTIGDEAVANSFTITISANAACDLVRNDTIDGATVSGSFSLGNGVTLTTNISGSITNTTTVSFAGATQATLIGNVSGGVGAGGAISNASTGTLNLSGNIRAGSGGVSVGNNSAGTLNIVGVVVGGTGSTRFGANNSSTGTLNITGSCIGGTGLLSHGAGATGNGGTINIFGNCIGGPGPNIAAGVGLSTGTGAAGGDNTAHTVNISGNCIGGAIGPGAANNFRGGIMTIFGIASGGTGGVGAGNSGSGFLYVRKAIGNDAGPGGGGLAPVAGISNSVFGTMYVEELEFGLRGQSPVSGPVFIAPKNYNSIVTSVSTLSTINTFYTSLSTSNVLPAVSSVRQGIIYNLGFSTGTMVVPSVSATEDGVVTDNATGIAALNGLDVLCVPVSAITIANTFGDVSKNAITTQTAGSTIAAFNT